MSPGPDGNGYGPAISAGFGGGGNDGGENLGGGGGGGAITEMGLCWRRWRWKLWDQMGLQAEGSIAPGG